MRILTFRIAVSNLFPLEKEGGYELCKKRIVEMLQFNVGRDQGRRRNLSFLRAVDDSLSRKEEDPSRVFQPPRRREHDMTDLL